MQVGNLYHSQEHGLIVVRKVSLTNHSNKFGKTLYKVVFLVVQTGRLGLAQITRKAFHERYMSL